MKILQPEETRQFLGQRSGRESNLSLWLKTLKVGETLVISKEEWTGNKAKFPYYRINYVSRTTGRKFIKGVLADGSGWWAKRIS